MPLKISFFNPGLFFNNLKRFWLSCFAYSFFLIVSLGGYLSSLSQRYDYSSNGADLNDLSLRLLTSNSGYMTYFFVLFPLLAALLVFSYMHFQKNTSMIHSLPLSRKTLFWTNYLSGLTLCGLPVVLGGLFLLFGGLSIGVPFPHHVFLWLGVSLLVTFLIYSFAVFAGMFTGHMGAHTLFFYIFNFLALFFIIVLEFILSSFVYGFNGISFSYSQPFSPFTYVRQLYLGFTGQTGEVGVIIGYLIAGILFTAAGYALYKRRHIETAGDVVSLSFMKPVFKYSVAFCASALLGIFILEAFSIEKTLLSIILCYFIGGFIGYYSSEMLLKKSFRVFKKAFLGFAVYSIVLALFLSSVYFDFYGYEERLPSPENVAAVRIGTYRDSRLDVLLKPEQYNPNQHSYLFSDPILSANPPSLLTGKTLEDLRASYGVVQDEATIRRIVALHRYIIENKTLYKEWYQSDWGSDYANAYSVKEEINPEIPATQPFSIYITYLLENGSILERSYPLYYDTNNPGQLDALLRELLSTPSLKTVYEPLYTITADDLYGISLYLEADGKSSLEAGGRIEVTDEGLMDSLLKTYLEDISLQEPLSPFITNSYYYGIVGNMEFVVKDTLSYNSTFYNKGTSRTIYFNYEKTLQLLKQEGIINALPGQ